MVHSKLLIASIHDVRPGLWHETKETLAWLRTQGILKTSLLVIPNYHERDSIDANPAFVRQLQEWQQQGHEIVLHAWTHRESFQGFQTPWQYVVSRIHTAGHGEFYRLDYQNALKSIEHGINLLNSLGFYPRGFVAPAWLYSKEAQQAIIKAGFKYYTTLTKFVSTSPNTFFPARALVWSHRKTWRRVVSSHGVPLLARGVVSRGEPFRLALHPPDIGYANLRRSAEKCINLAKKSGYQVATYAELLDAFEGAESLRFGFKKSR